MHEGLILFLPPPGLTVKAMLSLKKNRRPDFGQRVLAADKIIKDLSACWCQRATASAGSRAPTADN